MLETISAFWAQYGNILLDGTWDTIVMVVVSTVFAYVIGLPLGVLLNISQPHGIWPKKWVNRILGWIINIGRSLPFIILMIAIMPFTKVIVGTKIGVRGPSSPWWSPPPPSSPGWWRPPWRKWTPAWWRPPSPWGPPGSRS